MANALRSSLDYEELFHRQFQNALTYYDKVSLHICSREQPALKKIILFNSIHQMSILFKSLSRTIEIMRTKQFLTKEFVSQIKLDLLEYDFTHLQNNAELLDGSEWPARTFKVLGWSSLEAVMIKLSPLSIQKPPKISIIPHHSPEESPDQSYSGSPDESSTDTSPYHSPASSACSSPVKIRKLNIGTEAFLCSVKHLTNGLENAKGKMYGESLKSQYMQGQVDSTVTLALLLMLIHWLKSQDFTYTDVPELFLRKVEYLKKIVNDLQNASENVLDNVLETGSAPSDDFSKSLLDLVQITFFAMTEIDKTLILKTISKFMVGIERCQNVKINPNGKKLNLEPQKQSPSKKPNRFTKTITVADLKRREMENVVNAKIMESTAEIGEATSKMKQDQIPMDATALLTKLKNLLIEHNPKNRQSLLEKINSAILSVEI